MPIIRLRDRLRLQAPGRLKSRALSLAASLLLSLPNLVAIPPSESDAAPLFSGIESIKGQPTTDAQSQTVTFGADLPFQYQWQVLGPNEILLRLYNARLSSNLLTEGGKIRLEAGGILRQAALRQATNQPKPSADYQEIILTGPGLGSRQLKVEGGTEMPIALFKPIAPAPVAQPLAQTPILDTTDQPPLTASVKTPLKTSRSTGKTTKTKPVVRFPNLAELEKAQIGQGMTNEALAMLAASATSNSSNQLPRIDITPESTTAAKSPTSAQPGKNQSTAQLQRQAPQIEAVTNLSAQAARTFSNRQQARQRFSENVPYFPVGSRNPAPSRQTSWYQNDQDQIPPEGQTDATFEETPDTSPNLSETGPDTSSSHTQQSLIALPRYRGGAPPIRAITTNAQGKPVLLQPKNTAIPEVAFNDDTTPTTASGGFNTLFQAEPEDRVQTLMAEALKHYRQKSYEKALLSVQAALKEAPEQGNLHAAMAEIQIQRANLEAACQGYEKAMSLVPGQYETRYAQVLILAGKRPEAVRFLGKLSVNHTNRARIAYMLGALYQEQGETRQALPYLQEAARLKPESADIQYNLGLAFELSGQRAEAAQHYQKAVSLNPSAYDALEGLERVHN